MEIQAGTNIALKVPQYKWEDTVAFYRDRVGLPVRKEYDHSTSFAFGNMTLWIDCDPAQSQVDVWLELITDDPDRALDQLRSPERDALEPLGDVNGHWTSDPAGVVLLVRAD